MAPVRAPSQEQLKLLEELSAGSLLKEETVLSKPPDWSKLEQSGKISSEVAAKFRRLHSLSPQERGTDIKSNPDVSCALLLLLEGANDVVAIQYLLTLFYDVIRNDTSTLDAMLVAFKNTKNIFNSFIHALKRTNVDSFVTDKASFLISSLIPRAARNVFSDDEVLILIKGAVDGSFRLTDYGTLDCLKNLLKLDHYRQLVWEFPGVRELIVSHLDASKPTCVYPAVFCAWLITFNEKYLVPFTGTGAVEKICKVLRESKTEKVVRICIYTLLNCLPNDESVEAVIQQDALHTLTLLEYEKWRDEELYEEIRHGLAALQQKIKLFSNFDRYCRELNSGKLNWSFLHSEKFWHQNLMHFEANEFLAIKKLAHLLRSTDPVTSAVACYDLGEFARLHPTGKKVIQKFKAKEMVMILMSHKDRNVSREALLCVQKMMLDKWQNAATAVTV